MLVAIPTAIPEEPLMRRLGTLAGRTVGSSIRPSKLGTTDGLLVDVLQQLHRERGEAASVYR